LAIGWKEPVYSPRRSPSQPCGGENKGGGGGACSAVMKICLIKNVSFT
jgi:hypothetical protein